MPRHPSLAAPCRLVARVVLPVTVAAAAAVATLAAAAGPPSDPASAAPTRPAPVLVVAAENFWGDIAGQIGGRDARVTSLITSPNADPHLFESDARDAATLAAARVVIENGAGYDTWMSSLLGADAGHPRIVEAATVLAVHGSDPNPHLWYDIPQVPKVAASIAAALSSAAPRDAGYFRRNLTVFDASLLPLDATIAAIKAQHPGAPVAYTERVPGYLLSAAGLDVKTPPGFAKAVEDGTDPSLSDTVAMRRLLTGRGIDALLYNTQTVTAVTTQIRALARQNGIPVVGVSETMPPDVTYQQWQQSQLTALLRALGRHRTT